MKWNDFNEDWLRPGSVVEVTVPNLGACLREIGRLRQLHKSGSGSVTTLCIYCGASEELARDDPAAAASALIEHHKVCPRGPGRDAARYTPQTLEEAMQLRDRAEGFIRQFALGDPAEGVTFPPHKPVPLEESLCPFCKKVGCPPDCMGHYP